MKRGTKRDAVLRDDRKVVLTVGSFVFMAFPFCTAPVSEAVFYARPTPVCRAQLFTTQALLNFFNPYWYALTNIRDPSRIVAAAPVASRNARMPVEAEGCVGHGAGGPVHLPD